MGTPHQLSFDEGYVTFDTLGNMLTVTVDTDPYHSPAMSWTLNLEKDGRALLQWLKNELDTDAV